MKRIALLAGKVLAVLASVFVLLVGSCGRSQLTAETARPPVKIVTVSCWSEDHQLMGSAAAALLDGSVVELRCSDRMRVRLVR